MMKIDYLRKSLAVAAVSMLCASSAWATFIVDDNPGGDKFKFDQGKGSPFFTGSVGSELFDGEANVDVQTGGGYANIKADNKNDILNRITLTPQNDDVFSAFSFRGQLNSNGSVWVTVWDQLGNDLTFEFQNLGDNKGNFDRIGIISTDEQRIAKVEITSRSIFEIKQIDFNSATTTVPDGGLTAMLLGLGLTGLGMGRRFVK